MQQNTQNQVRELRAKSKGKLQSEYQIQIMPKCNVFVQDYMTQPTSKGIKGHPNLLYASAATENGEIQTLESIEEHRKKLADADQESTINQKSTFSVVNQAIERTNFVGFPGSLLSKKHNTQAPQHFQTEANKQSQNLIDQLSKDVQHQQALFEITEQAAKKKGKTDFQHNDQSEDAAVNFRLTEDIKTVKILPKNNCQTIYMESACQTDIWVGNLQQLQSQSLLICSKQDALKRDKNIRDVFDEQRDLKASYSNQQNISLDGRVQQKRLCHLQSPSKKKRFQDQNDACSSLSDKEGNQQIWEKDFFQLQYQEINQMHQRNTGSQTESQENKNEKDEPYIEKEKMHLQQLQKLRNQNEQFKAQIVQLTQCIKLTRVSEDNQKNKYKELQLNINQKFAQLLEENKELICLIQQYKQKIFNFEVQSKLKQNNLNTLQQQWNEQQSLIYKKEEENAELTKMLKKYHQEYAELQLINTQLQQILKTKQEQIQQKIIQLEREKANYNEVVFFYKEKLNQEGVTLQVQQLKEIKDYIENQKDLQSERIRSIENHFKKELKKVEMQKEAYIIQIISKFQEDKQKMKKVEEGENLEQIKGQIQDVIKQYDRQLEARDQQICYLKKSLKKEHQYQKQFCYNNCAEYIKHVRALTGLIKSKDCIFSQIEAEFIYIVDKLLKMNSILDKKNSSLQNQKSGLLTVIKKMQEFYQEELYSFKKQLEESKMEKKELEQSINGYINEVSQLRRKAQLSKKEKQTTILKLKYVTPINQSLYVVSTQTQRIVSESMKLSEQSKNFSKQVQREAKEQPFVNFKQFVSKRKFSEIEKLQISLILVQATKQRLKNCNKIQSFSVNEIYIREVDKKFEIQLRKKQQRDEQSNSQREMLYYAPQVLLGFAESQQSYVWTLGFIIDQLFNGSLFYKKLNEIKSRIDNYYCRETQIKIKSLLELILKKNHKNRKSLAYFAAEISKKIIQIQFQK